MYDFAITKFQKANKAPPHREAHPPLWVAGMCLEFMEEKSTAFWKESLTPIVT